MDAVERRGAGMSETLGMAFSPPNTAAFSFDALHRGTAADDALEVLEVVTGVALLAAAVLLPLAL
ncbi:MAG: hypothetical protein JWO90_1416, partial [Solirubrobacterales bacterium]|nr:hypothetical protein [Solirubrobacterales bacterium]